MYSGVGCARIYMVCQCIVCWFRMCRVCFDNESVSE